MKRDDSLWKAILEDIFDDFLRFFIPEADQIFDMARGFIFLDKELEQLFPVEINDFNPRYVDKLVKVFLQTGDEQWFLVHIEVQGSADPAFASRMFQYFSRINDKYQRPVAAFAILTDGNERFKPTFFSQSFFGTSIHYVFNTYKVMEQNVEALTRSDNPFAQVILTTQVAIRHKRRDATDLMEEKVALARGLLAKHYPKHKIRVLLNFLKLYVRFGDREKDLIFEDRLRHLTHQLPTTMGIEEFVLARAEQVGLEKGIVQGLEKGKKEGIELMIRALLTETDFSDEKIASLAGVSVEKVTQMRSQKHQ